MTRDPQSDVELVGDALPYADGSEDELGSIFATVADRSSSSDALAARIHDWPTRYHLSRQRSNLVRPLSIRPGLRVLDVGAGTGAISRYLGEQGAEVVALEGSVSRARAAAHRCGDLPNVRVVCGAVDDLDVEQPFDLVLVVGVLEYAEHTFGGGGGASSFLASVRRLTAPGGAVALAIENQLGLKYLLGYAEDHLGQPWAGVEGYRSSGGIRTYSRRQLGGLLDEAGLPVRRWLYPYPDYKLPSVVLSPRCFSAPDAGLLVDQLVRTPVVDHAYPRTRFCDDRAALSSFVQAGLGEDVANSFLVLAGDQSAVGQLLDDGVLAWLFGSERQAVWLRKKTLTERNGDRVVITTPRLDETRRRGWLSQRVDESQRFVAGPTLERLALDAVAEHDIEALATVLAAWRDYVLSQVTEIDGPDELPSHPFLRPSTRRLLPEDHLDVELANFVRSDEGNLHYVDREWCVDGGVDLDLAVTRALWSFAHRVIVSGVEMPWSATTTVDGLTVTLGSLCGFAVGEDMFKDWRRAEDELQEIVVGVDRGAGSRQRVWEGQLARVSFPAFTDLPSTALRRSVAALQHDLAVVDARAGALEKELEGVRRDVAQTTSEAAELRSALDAATAELAHHRARAAQFERRLLVRVYRLVARRPRAL